ncbi:unnamed protein product [Nezara viridula]|uniref:Uncharacterized protein n=1 Tax=Nezara viridula TaxID=85310 RepID=A0A9P0GXE8_NEZVI|nr:unnamed protein product [Nezara viridula]
MGTNVEIREMRGHMLGKTDEKPADGLVLLGMLANRLYTWQARGLLYTSDYVYYVTILFPLKRAFGSVSGIVHYSFQILLRVVVPSAAERDMNQRTTRPTKLWRCFRLGVSLVHCGASIPRTRAGRKRDDPQRDGTGTTPWFYCHDRDRQNDIYEHDARALEKWLDDKYIKILLGLGRFFRALRTFIVVDSSPSGWDLIARVDDRGWPLASQGSK